MTEAGYHNRSAQMAAGFRGYDRRYRVTNATQPREYEPSQPRAAGSTVLLSGLGIAICSLLGVKPLRGQGQTIRNS